MLSIWILGVRDVRRPSQESYCVDNGPILWAVQVTNGSQQHRTQFLPLPAGQGEDERLSGDKSRWEEEVEIADKGDQETVEIALLFDLSPKTLFTRMTSGRSPSGTREGPYELPPSVSSTSRTTLGRKLYRHSVTSIEMRTFRAQPEKKVNMWKPLRSAVPNFDADLGKIHLSVMYSDDSGDHGYFFALFCGLLPPRNLSLAQG